MSDQRITRTDTDDLSLLSVLMHGLDGDSSAGIYAQEAQGQRELVNSTQLPSDGPIAEAEALGIVFGPVDERDPMFRPATLPEGWEKRATDHSMWTDIVDDKGRKRLGVFYKAAFYDRSAHFGITPNYAPLDELFYGDTLPEKIELDELLTADVARGWFDDTLAQATKRLDYPNEDGHWTERYERVKAIGVLLEKAGVVLP